MVEVADGEEFKPCFGLRFGAMDEFIGRGEFAAKTACFSAMKARAMVMMVRQVRLARPLDD